MTLPPLALYIHVPWCVRKCPYCDFNSHQKDQELPEQAYVAALLADLDADMEYVQGRDISSIFIGGGTPSLFSAQAYEQLFNGLRKRLRWDDNAEITLEANPGTVEQQKFRDYRTLGINRLSIGVQSFNETHLQALGRIHGRDEALRAATAARAAGFDNFNLDLMHGLSRQSVNEAMSDLDQAIALNPTHLSWYQLTLEPNTVFFSNPPALPTDDLLADIEEAGFSRLADAGFMRYEISAFARQQKYCQHNKNYWEFGDYLGIGAGAHGKITLPKTQGVLRSQKTRGPKDYLAADFSGQRNNPLSTRPNARTLQDIQQADRPLEFMLNALRLTEGVPAELFAQHTGNSLESIAPILARLRARGLLTEDAARISCTPTGIRFLNDVVASFNV